MPSKAAHIAAAKRNEATAQYLLDGDDSHLAWVAAIVFYQALHIVEAVFDGDSAFAPSHTDDHYIRNKVLKTTNRYTQLWKMYRPLYEASLVARYLRDSQNAPTYDVFEKYMPRSSLQAKLIDHYLVGVKKTAARLLDDPNFFGDAEPSQEGAAPS